MGLGIAEAMDTAQRGMGLDWDGAYELIKQTKAALPNALVANGVGTDHLPADSPIPLMRSGRFMKQRQCSLWMRV